MKVSSGGLKTSLFTSDEGGDKMKNLKGVNTSKAATDENAHNSQYGTGNMNINKQPGSDKFQKHAAYVLDKPLIISNNFEKVNSTIIKSNDPTGTPKKNIEN